MKRHPKRSLLEQQEIKVINIGLELFAESLKEQQAKVVHVAWKPPAAGNPELMKMLEQIL